MSLMNTPFRPGECLAAVEDMEAGLRRDIAQAEYYYFTGRPEEAARAAEACLTSPDTGARLSACLLYAYANLSIGEIQRARFALGELNASLAGAGELVPQFQAAAAFVTSAGGRCCFTCRYRRNCPRGSVFCPCCRRGCGPLPSMLRLTISI